MYSTIINLFNLFAKLTSFLFINQKCYTREALLKITAIKKITFMRLK